MAFYFFHSCRCLLVAAATVIVCLFPFFSQTCVLRAALRRSCSAGFSVPHSEGVFRRGFSTQMVRLLPISVAVFIVVHFKTSRALSFLPTILFLDHPSWFSHMFCYILTREHWAPAAGTSLQLKSCHHPLFTAFSQDCPENAIKFEGRFPSSLSFSKACICVVYGVSVGLQT